MIYTTTNMSRTLSTKQSAVAMRKHMSDETNKYNFNRKRILNRIRKGSIPQQETTKKYNISNAEINVIRKEGNFPPLTVSFAPTAYAPQLASMRRRSVSRSSTSNNNNSPKT